MGRYYASVCLTRTSEDYNYDNYYYDFGSEGYWLCFCLVVNGIDCTNSLGCHRQLLDAINIFDAQTVKLIV